MGAAVGAGGASREPVVVTSGNQLMSEKYPNIPNAVVHMNFGIGLTSAVIHSGKRKKVTCFNMSIRSKTWYIDPR